MNSFREKVANKPDIDYESIDDRKRKILGEVSDKLSRWESVPLTPAFMEELKTLGIDRKVHDMVQDAERKYRMICLVRRGDDDFTDPYNNTDAPYSSL